MYTLYTVYISHIGIVYNDLNLLYIIPLFSSNSEKPLKNIVFKVSTSTNYLSTIHKIQNSYLNPSDRKMVHRKKN